MKLMNEKKNLKKFVSSLINKVHNKPNPYLKFMDFYVKSWTKFHFWSKKKIQPYKVQTNPLIVPPLVGNMEEEEEKRRRVVVLWADKKN